jgi:hypothetical protein
VRLASFMLRDGSSRLLNRRTVGSSAVARGAGGRGGGGRAGDIKVLWLEGGEGEGSRERERLVTETAFDATVTCTQRLTNGVRTQVCDTEPGTR